MDIQTAIHVLLEAYPEDIGIQASQDDLNELVKHLKSVSSRQRISNQALNLLKAVVKNLPQLWEFTKAENPDEVPREKCWRDKRLQDIINVEGSNTIRDRLLRGAAQRSLAKDYIDKQSEDKPSKITEICEALNSPSRSAESLKTILYPDTASDSYSAYVDKYIQIGNDREKQVATRSISTGLKRLVLDELFSQKLGLSESTKTAVLSTVSSLPIKSFQNLRYEDICDFINLILMDKSEVKLDESQTTLPASLEITRDVIFKIAPWCDQFDQCYHIISKPSSDGQTPSLQQSRLLLDDLNIVEILAQISRGNPEINDLRVEPSVAYHRLDPTGIQGDVIQTASRKRRSGTDTGQSEKRVKRGRAKRAQREGQPSSYHESSSTQQGLNGSDESHPQMPRTESGTIDEAIAASTYDPSAETHTDPFGAVQVSIAATEESPHPPVSTGEDAISTAESTSEVDGSTDTTSSEATFLAHDSISGETPNHWTVGVELGCNLRFQTVNHEPSIQRAASVLYAIQNQEACSRISQSLPQSFEALGQPIQPFQQSETTQSFDLYDQVPLAADLTQPLADRTVQDGAQSYVTCGSQGFEEIDFDTRQPTDPHGFDAISFNSQSNAWFANDSQGFEQVSFNAQNRILHPAPWQGFECMSFNDSFGDELVVQNE